MGLLLPQAVLGCEDLESYRRYHEAFAAKAGQATVVRHQPLAVYVNGGRVVADCPHCASGISVHPDWPEARCFGAGCYGVFQTLQLPDLVSAEQVLLARPLANQNWDAHKGETLGQLVAENVARGLPGREPTAEALAVVEAVPVDPAPAAVADAPADAGAADVTAEEVP